MRIINIKPYHQKATKSDTLEENSKEILAYFHCMDCKTLSDGLLEDNLIIDLNEKSEVCGIELIMPKEKLVEKEVPGTSGEKISISVSDDKPQMFQWYLDKKKGVIIGISDTWKRTYKLSDSVGIGVKNNVIVMWWFKLPKDR